MRNMSQIHKGIVGHCIQAKEEKDDLAGYPLLFIV